MGAILRPAAAQGAQATVSAAVFGDALSASMVVAPGSAEIAAASLTRGDKADALPAPGGAAAAFAAALSPSTAAPPEAVVASGIRGDEPVSPPLVADAPLASKPLPIAAAPAAVAKPTTAPPAKAPASALSETAAQRPAPANGATAPTATPAAVAMTAASEPDASAPASPAPAGAEPEAKGSSSAEPPVPVLVVAPAATPIVVAPVALSVQVAPPSASAKDDRTTRVAPDRNAASPDAQTGAKAATPTSASEGAAAAALPAAPAPPGSDALQQSFAERVAAEVGAPGRRPTASVSSKSGEPGCSTAVSASSAKPMSAAAPMAAAVPPVAVAAVEAAAQREDADAGNDGAPQGGGGFEPAGSAPSAAVIASPGASSSPVAGAPDTVASFAAALVQRLGQRVSRFQVVLNPEGLGQVDVSMKIDAQGALEAHIACDKDGGADALKARTGELAASLQQAGFSIAADALKIDSPPAAASAFFAGADASGGDARDQRGATPAAWRSAHLANLDAGADLAPAAYAIAGRARGLDIRI